ncbi:MAG: SsrA-binding protein SmpB [Candidatus Paceibacterota bacterium]
MKTFINNRRASFDFEILDTFEAGISLLGTEVKSVRHGQGKLEGTHVIIRGGEAFLVGASIPAFQRANAPADFDPERPRKLLLSKKELARLETEGEQAGLTIVPLRLYNNNRRIKLTVALVRGKKKRDKRETIKQRDTKRSIERILKNQ